MATFRGTYEELQARLKALDGQGQWLSLSDGQKQFRHHNGGIMNWYATTGSINFQGKSDGKNALATLVNQELEASYAHAGADTSSPTAINSVSEQPAETSSPQLSPTNHPSSDQFDPSQVLLGQRFYNSELIVGLVGAVGTDLDKVGKKLKDLLELAGYTVENVHISSDIIPEVVPVDSTEWSTDGSTDHYKRISRLMDAGNQARLKTKDNAILALGAASLINFRRPPNDDDRRSHRPRHAYILHSLKHPDEVQCLREIYPQGFYLLGVHSDKKRRKDYLQNWKHLSDEEAEELIERDKNEHVSHGQRVSDTFHLSDFFVLIDGNEDRFEASLRRIVAILFGHPNMTPTFDEYAMFQAFVASLRSADLSRQVGAVIAKETEIVATGANDCPRFGGGLYWPILDMKTGKIQDELNGRDYMRGEDSNKVHKQAIIDKILEEAAKEKIDKDKLRPVLQASPIRDLTEFGRVVHAEMEALLSCARNHITTRGATIYCTTFPCHNCAKHIIAAGIKRVVYVEPYEKSKAIEFHDEAIKLGFPDASESEECKVHFEPFVGVGPRHFFDLFSMSLGSGFPLKRKDDDGRVLDWKLEAAKLRRQMLPADYLVLESIASTMFIEKKERLGHD